MTYNTYYISIIKLLCGIQIILHYYSISFFVVMQSQIKALVDLVQALAAMFLALVALVQAHPPQGGLIWLIWL